VNRSFLELAEALGVQTSGPIGVIQDAESPAEGDEPADRAGRRQSSGRGVRRDLPVATH
jgi:hypothetical protein